MSCGKIEYHKDSIVASIAGIRPIEITVSEVFWPSRSRYGLQ